MDALFSKKRTSIGKIFLGIFIVLLLVGLFVTMLNIIFISQIQLERQYVTIPDLPAELENFRILHISDLHGKEFGNKQSKIAQTIKELRYEMVCISGDMVGANGDFSAFNHLLEILSEDAHIYYVQGDEDPNPYATSFQLTNNTKAEYVLAAEKRGATLLDKPQKITYKNHNIWLCPHSLYTQDMDNTYIALQEYLGELVERPKTTQNDALIEGTKERMQAIIDAQQVIQSMSKKDLYLCLTHIPFVDLPIDPLEIANDKTEKPYEHLSLIMSGHYNNGQCRLPYVGAIHIPQEIGYQKSGWFLNDENIAGLSYVNGIPQYINYGLGASSLYPLTPFRFFNQPRITLITLTGRIRE